MNYKNLSLSVLLILLLAGFTNPPAEKSKWKPLFNGKNLSGWDTYLGPKYDTVTKKRETVPVGLNNDPSKVFSVVELDGEKVLRISGENFGSINTKSEYENYHLQLQFRWGNLKWFPRKAAKRDSGVMYHSVGPNGADGGNWMRSHEFQVQEGDCGDYWGCAGAVFDVKAQKYKDNLYIYSKDGNLLTFSTGSPTGRRCIKFPDAEKPTGEWNTIDLYCFGNTSVHMINGVVNMVLHNSRQIEGGSEIPLVKGKIQIQSEGSEVYYRNIKICEIKKLPDDISKE
jgi:hypothetical protein